MIKLLDELVKVLVAAELEYFLIIQHPQGCVDYHYHNLGEGLNLLSAYSFGPAVARTKHAPRDSATKKVKRALKHLDTAQGIQYALCWLDSEGDLHLDFAGGLDEFAAHELLIDGMIELVESHRPGNSTQ